MTRSLRVCLCLLVASFGLIAPAAAQDEAAAAQRFVVALATRALDIAQSDERTDPEFRRLVQDGFAVGGIARFVLGSHWRHVSTAERTQYLALFEDLLVDATANQMRRSSALGFETLSATRVQGPRKAEHSTIVRSRLRLADGSTIRLDWRVTSNGRQRRVTDVMIEGLSMVQTYRDEFMSLARRRGITGLLTELRRRDDLALNKRDETT